MSTGIITLPRRRPTPTLTAREDRGRHRIGALLRSEGRILFAVFTCAYLLAAVAMVDHNIMFADALSRVGNGYYVLFSRDPHLPAVGFVWNPLPSLVLLPLFPFKGLLPVLVHKGFAGNISSAVLMAGSVAVLASCLRGLGVSRVPRLALTVVFAVAPMILLYGGSGLSEPALLFFVLLATKSLIGWVADRSPSQLTSAGLALGLAYLTRYEAVAPAAAVAALVGVASLLASREDGRTLRCQDALNDVALVSLPFVFAFTTWAAMAKILVHAWLPTFSSQYGNSAQVGNAQSSIRAVTGDSLLSAAGYAGKQILGLAPGLVPLLVLAIIVGARRGRRLAALAVVTPLGSVLFFDNAVFLAGDSFGWLRFQIAAIPLTVLLAGLLVGTVRAPAARPAVPQPRRPAGERPALRRVLRMATVPVMVAVVAAGLPVEFRMLTTTRGGLAREESPMLRATFYPHDASKEDRRSLRIFQTEREIAGYIDGLHPGTGSVLTDTAYAYPVVLASSRPRQYVITSDRDFKKTVADPSDHHVRYLLVPAPSLGPADALEKQWPGLYENGGRVGVLEREWRGKFYGDWRLYRVRATTP